MEMRGTTVLCVRRGTNVVLAGDGQVTMNNVVLKANARKVSERARRGEAEYHFIEVMTCPGGCIGGGGQPRMTDNSVRLARIQAIYREDEGRPLRKSHDNPAITAIYSEFLGPPLSEKSHELLHTKYVARRRV